MLIAKADGTTEEFDPRKLVSSLKRSGAKESTAEQIALDIEQELWDGMSTEEIYSRAFARLREQRHGEAARYSLKRAVLDFGPSGFPFEDYIGELFRAEGKKTSVRKVIKGRCVEHEVDVVVEDHRQGRGPAHRPWLDLARSDDESGDKEGPLYVEAKFHNAAGFKTDLKVVLYVQARVDDIGDGRGMVATNTKFTAKAIEYASCKKLELLAWDYPQEATLHDRIDKAGLYPITALTSLSRGEKTALLSQQVVLCKTLPERTDVLGRAGVSGKKVDRVLEEVEALCVPGKGV